MVSGQPERCTQCRTVTDEGDSAKYGTAWNNPRLSMEPTKCHSTVQGVESLHAVRSQPTPGCIRRLQAEDTGAVFPLHTRKGGSFKPDYCKTEASQEGKRNGRTAGCTSEGSSPWSRDMERRSEWIRMEPPSSWTKRSEDTCQSGPVTERRKLVDSPSSSVSGLDETGITTGKETKSRTVACSTSRRSSWRQPVSKERPKRITLDR